MEIMIIMLRKEKQHGQEFDVMHTHEHCFLQLSSQSKDCTQIQAHICFSNSCGLNKQLKMLMQSRPNLQSHREVLPKNFYFWSPSEHQVSGRHHFFKVQFLTATWNRFIYYCPWKARSSLFPDEMSQESNMSSCRGFAAVSRHLVARLSEHVREAHPTRKLQQYSWHQSIVARTRYE